MLTCNVLTLSAAVEHFRQIPFWSHWWLVLVTVEPSSPVTAARVYSRGSA